MVEFYLLASATEARMKILVFTRTELTTSALVGVRGYLLDHSGDEGIRKGRLYLAQSGDGRGSRLRNTLMGQVLTEAATLVSSRVHRCAK